MLFMSVYTYEPGDRDAVMKRRVEQGAMVPQGVRVVGEWGSLSGGRVFRLVEAEDPKAFLGAAMAWTDLGKIETYPVMPTEEVMKLVESNK